MILVPHRVAKSGNPTVLWCAQKYTFGLEFGNMRTWKRGLSSGKGKCAIRLCCWNKERKDQKSSQPMHLGTVRSAIYFYAFLQCYLFVFPSSLVRVCDYTALSIVCLKRSWKRISITPCPETNQNKQQQQKDKLTGGPARTFCLEHGGMPKKTDIFLF